MFKDIVPINSNGHIKMDTILFKNSVLLSKHKPSLT